MTMTKNETTKRPCPMCSRIDEHSHTGKQWHNWDRKNGKGWR